MTHLSSLEKHRLTDQEKLGYLCPTPKNVKLAIKKISPKRGTMTQTKSCWLTVIPPKDVAKNLGVSIPTRYRWIPASEQA